jgi:hypothetical protein
MNIIYKTFICYLIITLGACGSQEEVKSTRNLISKPENFHPKFERSEFEHIDSLTLKLTNVKNWGNSDWDAYDLIFENNDKQKFIFQFDYRSSSECFEFYKKYFKDNSWREVLKNKVFKVYVDSGFGFPDFVEPLIGACYVTEENGYGMCWPLVCLKRVNDEEVILSNMTKSPDLIYEEIKGVWKRNDNSALNGMLVKIERNSSEIYGKIIYVPEWSVNNLTPQAWTIGMIKWKNIKKQGAKYEFEDLSIQYEKILDFELEVTNKEYIPESFTLSNKNELTCNQSKWSLISN